MTDRDDKADVQETLEYAQARHQRMVRDLAAQDARIAALEAALADAVGALDAAAAELSEFANILSREPREANLTYQSARDAQDVLARAALVKP